DRRPAGKDDEYDERGPVKRFFAKVWKPALVVCAIGFITVVAAFGVAYALMPSPTEMGAQASATDASTSIRFADETEATTFGEVNRIPVEREQIPESVVSGVIGSEQRGFWEDPAISPTGTARAVLSGGSAGGGSSITQQMARNYYDGLSQDRSYLRKFKEIIVAFKVEQSLTKDEILTQYLNTIYFGRNAYGVQAAAQAYFGKNVEDLSSAEGAFIGAIIQQPGNFQNVEPGSEMEEVLKGRWDYAVNGMVVLHEEDPERGISQAEADELEFPETIPFEPGDNYAGYNGYIIQAVQEELKERYDLTDQQLALGGYQVTTSLEKKYMDAANKAFDEGLPGGMEAMPERTNYGLASVDPRTGEVKGFYGGADFSTDTNNSLTERAQAGSAFKPYVLATGLSQGISLNSTFDGDSPQEFPGVGEPIQNDSNVSHGQVNLVESTAESINTSFVELAIQVTPAAVTETARKAGIPEEQFETAEMGPNIALGTYQVTALDQAAGFSTFANGGVHMPQHMVTGVKDAEGNVLEPNDADRLESGNRAFSADVAADATYAMTQVVDGGGGENAALPDRPVAGKTGTSNSAKSAWFVGYTPQLSTAVGLSRDDGQALDIPGVDAIYGGTTSAKVWRAYMSEVMEGEEVMRFPPRANVGDDQNFAPTPSTTPSETATPDTETSEPPDLETSEPPDPSTSESPEEVDCDDPMNMGNPQCEDEQGETGDPENPDDCVPSVFNDCDDQQTEEPNNNSRDNNNAAGDYAARRE
ncbi:transglycosylase domain-containing protein, partial [Spinactinospora alkalitolerans]|uniref:transglycosylase domain-containing protein n=1 Tax=Spinactinospora alkalitolerans TaxID=687207 RepID=UPI0031DB73BA